MELIGNQEACNVSEKVVREDGLINQNSRTFIVFSDPGDNGPFVLHLQVCQHGGSRAEDGHTALGSFPFLLKILSSSASQSNLLVSSEMIFTISRKNMSQKLSFLLLVFGLIWGLMLLHYTFQQPRHQSSVKLREQILDLSKRYVKALAEESKSMVDVDSGASMAGYGKNHGVFVFSFPARSCVSSASVCAFYKLIF